MVAPNSLTRAGSTCASARTRLAVPPSLVSPLIALLAWLPPATLPALLLVTLPHPLGVPPLDELWPRLDEDLRPPLLPRTPLFTLATDGGPLGLGNFGAGGFALAHRLQVNLCSSHTSHVSVCLSAVDTGDDRGTTTAPHSSVDTDASHVATAGTASAGRAALVVDAVAKFVASVPCADPSISSGMTLCAPLCE